MTNTIGMLGPENCFEPSFEVSRYFDLGARNCVTERPLCGAHFSLQSRIVPNNQQFSALVSQCSLVCIVY